MITRGFKLKHKAVVVLFMTAGLFAAITCTIGKTTAPKSSPFGVLPGPNDARIAYVTAQLMENFQYSQQQFDRSISEKFFDEYVSGMSGLDPRRENFLQSDIDEFARYRTNLDIYTVGDRGRADLEPAYVIYERFKERLAQHAAYVDELLREGKLNFDNDGQIELDRRDSPWPKNLAEAQKLWRDRLRYEFLQDKLDREISAVSAAHTNWEEMPPKIFSETNFLTKSNLADITTQLRKHYDWTLHMMTNWDSDSILQAYLEAMVHAYDPHSDYLNTAHAEDFSINMSLSLYGIGAQLVEQDGYCTIDSLVPGGPADRSKQLHPRDKIVAVAQSNQPPVNVVDVDLPKVVGMIRGSKGTQVRLTIVPAEDSTARRIVTLTREEIKLEDQRAKAKLIEFPDINGRTKRIGVVEVPSFYAPIGLPGNEDPATNYISADVAALVKKLEQENVNGIILDLRGDPGGSLEESVNFVGLFIKDGPVVQARDAEKTVTVYADTDTNILYSGPLVVLANRFSASASEIAAGALQDYGRAVIVGDTNTFGKGTVQQLTPLRPFIWATPDATNDPGTLKITIRKFYRVSGASTQFKGVESDIVLPDILNYSTDIGEKALDNPLPWDTNAPVVYEPVNMVQPYLRALRLRSAARVATNRDFSYIRQDIEEFRKLQADKTASLNEQEELEERQRNAEKDKERDAERASRSVPNEKIYDISVEDAAKPGLSAPEILTATNFEEKILNAKTNRIEKIVNAAPVDPMLDEGEHILEDYISLLSTNKY